MYTETKNNLNKSAPQICFSTSPQNGNVTALISEEFRLLQHQTEKKFNRIS